MSTISASCSRQDRQQQEEDLADDSPVRRQTSGVKVISAEGETSEHEQENAGNDRIRSFIR